MGSCLNLSQTVQKECNDVKVDLIITGGRVLRTFYNIKNTEVLTCLYIRRHNVLEMTDGIDNPGHLNLKLATCLFVAWVLVYLCVWKGIRTTGKVVYVTATLPYVFLVILFIRAITLPGSTDGIMYYVTPIWTRLADPKVTDVSVIIPILSKE